MKKNITIVLTILLIGSLSDHSSASDIDSTKSRIGISASFWQGFRTDNGIQFGIERYQLETKKYTIVQNVSMLVQQRADIYTSIGLTIGSTIRRNSKWGGYMDHTFRIGYNAQKYRFDIYETNDDDEIINVGRKWQSAMLVGYSFAVGYDFSALLKKDVRVYIRPNYYLKVPNNENLFLLNNVGFEYGAIVRFKKK